VFVLSRYFSIGYSTPSSHPKVLSQRQRCEIIWNSHPSKIKSQTDNKAIVEILKLVPKGVLKTMDHSTSKGTLKAIERVTLFTLQEDLGHQ
jgi:hypothetical protein